MSAEKKPADAKCTDCRVVPIEGTIFTQRILCPRHRKRKEMHALVQAAKGLATSVEKRDPQIVVIEGTYEEAQRNPEGIIEDNRVAFEAVPGYAIDRRHTQVQPEVAQLLDLSKEVQAIVRAGLCSSCQKLPATHPKVGLCDGCYAQEVRTRQLEAKRRQRERERGSHATLFDIRDPTRAEYRV